MLLGHDIRDAFRGLRKAPAFSIVVTLTVALGIGATTAIFSVVEAVLLRPLPYPADRSLVMLFDVQSSGREAAVLSFPEFADWRDRGTDVFRAIGAFGVRGEALSGAGEAEQLLGVQVSIDLPGLLGLRPILGRSFTATDEVLHGPQVVILGEGLWRGHFAADPAIVGRTVTLTGVSYQVIGVFPSSPSAILPVPYFMRRGTPVDFWEPLQLDSRTAPRGLHQLSVIARLRPDVTIGQAAGRIEEIGAEIKKDRSSTHGMHIHPLASVLVGDFETPLALLLSAVAVLLLIACGNVANLLLARSTARQREFAVRSALGADRGRLMSLVLADSVLRSVIGGAVGIGLAYLIVQTARAALVGAIPRIGTATIDTRTLGVACIASLLSGVVFGLAPAFRAGRRDVKTGLSGSRGAIGNASRDGVRQVLIGLEIALSFLLLVTAALLAESYVRLLAVPKGFEPGGLVTARVWLPPMRYPDGGAQNAFFTRLTDRIGATVGLANVALTSDLPIAEGTYGSVLLNNPRFPDGAANVEKRIVAANYFTVLKARVVRGRFFEPSDRQGSEPVVIVNETFARQWLEGNPIGQRVSYSGRTDGQQTVVGVVQDIREGALGEPSKASIYVPSAQQPSSDMYIVVRTSSSAVSEVVSLVRQSVAGIDPALPVINVKTGPDLVASSVRPEQLTSAVLGAFAISALLLAAIGLYGVISYSVAERTQELGVRAALGAQRGDLMRLVLAQTLGVAAVGAGCGAGLSLAVARFLSAQLFGVSASSPRVFGAVAILVFLVALLAGTLPTLRATRVNPLDALRVGQ